ncbi:hypothetical protein FM104_03110 [Microbacterium esteraromaticum]|uniref:Uncharacterized protein n=1 Tax=Microbacterium esteraromaticum TaxID=57043 RepID=A0A1R4IN70_9MICO|nr:hypothetical protein FM104_03110 [Microbacterium esteraromaticum]
MAALSLVMIFALTGCGDDDIDQAASANGGAASDGDNAPDTDADAPTDAEDDAEEATDIESADVPAGVECLYGNWYVDNDAFKEMLKKAGGRALSVSGWAIVTYNPDGTSLATFDEWTTVTQEQGAKATMVRNGEDQATYVVTGDQITTTETVGSSVLMMTMQMEGKDAITVEAPHEPFSVTTGTFTCTAETLTVNANGATSVLLREH